MRAITLIVIIVLIFALYSASKNPEGNVPKVVLWFENFIKGFWKPTQLPNLQNISSNTENFINESLT